MLLVSFVVSCCRPSRSSDLVPRLAVVGVALPLSFADRSSMKTKYFIDYDYELPPMESNHRKGHAGHGLNGLLINLDTLYRLAVDITVTGLV